MTEDRSAPADGVPTPEGGPDPDDRRGWPIFVVGCHRSGTTLVRFVLDTHPAIACPPESKFISGLQQFSDYPQLRQSLHSMGVTIEALHAEFARMTDSIMMGYATRRKKRRWADKTPNYYRILPFLNDIFGGRALFLFVARHPFDTINSLVDFVDRGAGAGADPEFARISERYGVGPHAWARYWSEVYESIDAFRAQYPDNGHLVRYEDLVRQPELTVGPVFDFLGEDHDPKLLSKIFLSYHDRGLEDYKIRFTTRIHDQSVGTWRSWPPQLTESLWPVVGPQAERLGYAIGDPVPQPLTRPVRSATG